MKRAIVDALALWREAEQVRDDLPPDHPSRAAAGRVSEEMRELHARLTQEGAASDLDMVAEARQRIQHSREVLDQAEREAGPP